MKELDGVFHLLVQGDAEAKAEFGVVFKQGIGPGGAASFGVVGPRGGGQVAAVNGGAARGVGYVQGSAWGEQDVYFSLPKLVPLAQAGFVVASVKICRK